MRQLLGTVVPCTEELCVLVGVKGACVVNSTTGQPKEFLGPNPEASSFTLRWNDGKCDPQGRLWVGSMEMMFGEDWCNSPSNANTAALWCFEGSGDSLKITKKLSGITISNGLVWNKAGDTFYYIDTPTLQVDAFNFDGAKGEITNRRCVIKCPAEGSDEFHGYPDGCTIADDDTIFIACWNGGCVARYDPITGKLLKKYTVPGASQVTSCAFGGPNLDQLYITTASCGIEEARLTRSGDQVHAGHLFKVDLSSEGVKGVPANSYRLSIPEEVVQRKNSWFGNW
jgi:sugar lactone lactonase YvrE